MKSVKNVFVSALGMVLLAGILIAFSPTYSDAASAVKIRKNNQTVKLNKGSRASLKLSGKALKKLKNSKKKLKIKYSGKSYIKVSRSKKQKKKYSFSVSAISVGNAKIKVSYKKAKITIKVNVLEEGAVINPDNQTNNQGNGNSNSNDKTITDTGKTDNNGNVNTGDNKTDNPNNGTNDNNDPLSSPEPTKRPLRVEITIPESDSQTVDGKEKLTDLTTYSIDGKSEFNLWKDNSGRLYYNVVRDGKNIVDISSLGLVLANTDLSKGLSYDKDSIKTYELFEEYKTLTLSAATATNHCQERVVTFKNNNNASFDLVIRVYDDGVAYRYTNVTSGNGNTLVCTNEVSNVMLPVGTTTWGGWGGLNTYEHDYSEMNYNSFLSRNGKFDTPFLANVGNYWVLISEAQIFNNNKEFCKSLLKTTSNSRSLEWEFGDGRDESVPLSEQARRQNTNLDLVNVAQKTITQFNTNNGFSSPWRAMVISDDFNKFCTSTLISNLNPAPEESEHADLYEDISWLKPGKVLWSWWSDGNNQGNYNTHKNYIDLAAEYGFDYICLDVGWRTFENRLKELCDYAAERNVKVFCWVNYWELTTEDDIENLFSKWADAGAVGLKTDYFEGEDQKVLEVMENIALIAAKHHMMVLYHGCPTPGGEYRTYPNIMTTEAVLGEENRKWSNSPSSKNCLMYPFTRNVLGSMDYTPACKEIKNMIGETEGFALAKAVVYESSLLHFAAAAAEYRSFVGLQFMKDLCTTWDESFVPSGEAYPGKYITFVRRNGKKWYAGSMTLESRRATINCEFLDEDKSYVAHIYESNSSGKLTTRNQNVTSEDTLSFSLRAQDGVSVYFEEK